MTDNATAQFAAGIWDMITNLTIPESTREAPGNFFAKFLLTAGENGIIQRWVTNFFGPYGAIPGQFSPNKLCGPQLISHPICVLTYNAHFCLHSAAAIQVRVAITEIQTAQFQLINNEDNWKNSHIGGQNSGICCPRHMEQITTKSAWNDIQCKEAQGTGLVRRNTIDGFGQIRVEEQGGRMKWTGMKQEDSERRRGGLRTKLKGSCFRCPESQSDGTAANGTAWSSLAVTVGSWRENVNGKGCTASQIIMSRRVHDSTDAARITLYALEEGPTPNDDEWSATQISGQSDDSDNDEWIGWRERAEVRFEDIEWIVERIAMRRIAADRAITWVRQLGDNAASQREGQLRENIRICISQDHWMGLENNEGTRAGGSVDIRQWGTSEERCLDVVIRRTGRRHSRRG
ncbi:hypothetical protein B0H13DRAFT_1891701 [Mycena leptocephala]|nr:hypothetical protein B0H13DRAFT_1891701 [Mycena leptocephala]